jgi:ABC-type Fe3+-hydroxamate transport system substrate-binding protein
VAGPGSFYDDLLTRAGHRNVAETAGRPFAPLSLEFIVQADPDVIIELVAEAQLRPDGDAEARHVWAQLGPLTAVRQERVHVLRGHQHLILGPRVAHTFEALCRIIAGQHDASG